jgi:hypothetical protein
MLATGAKSQCDAFMLALVLAMRRRLARLCLYSIEEADLFPQIPNISHSVFTN